MCGGDPDQPLQKISRAAFPSNLKFHLMHHHNDHIHVQGEERRTKIEVLDICFENLYDLFCCLVCCYSPPKPPRHGYTAPRGGLCCSCFITADVERVMNLHPLHPMQQYHPEEAQFVDQLVVEEQQTVRQQTLRRQYLDRLQEAQISPPRPVTLPQRWEIRYRLLTIPAICLNP